MERLKRVDGFGSVDTKAICYGRDECGWWLYLPGVGSGMLTNHNVTENDDGTITIYPSVKLSTADRMRHGWVRNGVWDPCTDSQEENV